MRASQPATAYQLYIYLHAGTRLAAGALAERRLPAGWYVYTGSAKRGLLARVRRHLSAAKRRRWHIDWLLQDTPADVVWVALSDGNECALNRAVGGAVVYPGFGASDCRQRCGAHTLSRQPASGCCTVGARPGAAACTITISRELRAHGGDR